MERILSKKTPTRISFWGCGYLYCAAPLGIAGLVVTLSQGLACQGFISGWVLIQAVYTLAQPLFTLPFYISPNARTKSYFLCVSVIFLIWQLGWIITGTVLLAQSGEFCKARSQPTWIMSLVLVVLGYLGLLQAIGIVFDASSVHVETLEYEHVGGGIHSME